MESLHNGEVGEQILQSIFIGSTANTFQLHQSNYNSENNLPIQKIQDSTFERKIQRALGALGRNFKRNPTSADEVKTL